MGVVTYIMNKFMYTSKRNVDFSKTDKEIESNKDKHCSLNDDLILEALEKLDTIIKNDSCEDDFRYKLEFLYYTLNALDSRRDAIDARANIVLLLSTIVFGFFSSQLSDGGLFYPENTFNYIATLLILAATSSACIFSVRLISPIVRNSKERQNTSKSLSWFYLISNMTKDEYASEIRSANNEVIINELSTQVVLISKLLTKRYLRSKIACYSLYISLALLTAYIGIVLLNDMGVFKTIYNFFQSLPI